MWLFSTCFVDDLKHASYLPGVMPFYSFFLSAESHSSQTRLIKVNVSEQNVSVEFSELQKKKRKNKLTVAV